MRVDLDVLKSALVQAVEDHIAVHQERIVNLDKDFYWTVLDEQLFDLNQQPRDLGVGNLEEEFSDILRHMEEGEPLGSVEMQHLAALLTWLSARAGETPS